MVIGFISIFIVMAIAIWYFFDMWRKSDGTYYEDVDGAVVKFNSDGIEVKGAE